MQTTSSIAAFRRFSGILCIFVLSFAFINAKAQTSDVPHIISYQGQITTTDGIAMNGTHHITATLYSDHLGKNPVWQGNYDAVVMNGVFNILLGSGKSKLPDVSVMNRPLWVGIKVDESDEMRPLSQLSATPYALNVPDKSITQAKLADDVLSGMMGSGLTPKVQTPNTTVYWSEMGNTSVNGPSKFVGTTDGSALWLKVNTNRVMQYIPETRNITVGAPTHSSDAPDILGGCDSNKLTSHNADGKLYGATIAGGGGYVNTIGTTPVTDSINEIHADFATISGGSGNVAGNPNNAEDRFQTVAGGVKNTAEGDDAVVSGGQFNYAYGDESIVGGGSNDTAGGSRSVVVGGYNNAAHGEGSFIGGGEYIGHLTVLNNSALASNSIIVGGYQNSITSGGTNSVISGGNGNLISGTRSAIPGGAFLTLGANSFGFNGQTSTSTWIDLSAQPQVAVFNEVNVLIGNHDSVARALRFYTPTNNYTYGANYTSFKAGIQSATIEYLLPLTAGTQNQVLTTDSVSHLSWTDKNALVLKWYAESIVDPFVHAQATDTGAVSHGENVLAIGKYSSIGGGRNNLIDTGSEYSVIGGGLFNKVRAPLAVICGGDSNYIGIDQYNSSYNFIGGGLLDTIDGGSPYNVVCGGWKNHNGGGWSLMGSGARNYIYDNSMCDLIGSGRDNFIGNQSRTPLGKGISYSSIVGGDSNFVAAGWSGIVGGKWNFIGDVSEYSSVGGGFKDTIRGMFGVIAGGDSNAIRSNIGHGTSDGCAIGGGKDNFINALDSGFLGGHYPGTYVVPQYATVAGGKDNCVYGHYASVGGGWHNFSPGAYSVIPGGIFLQADDYQTVVGRCNMTTSGSTPEFLNNWKSANRVPFNSPAGSANGQIFPTGDYWTFIVGNGSLDSTQLPSTILKRSNAFMVADMGYSMVTGANHSGGATMGDSIRSMFKGGTYTDNVIDAWGIAKWDLFASHPIDSFKVVQDFGCSNVTRTGKGVYQVTLNLIDPQTGSSYTLTNASVTATLMDIGNAFTDCCTIMVGQISGNAFTIKIKFNDPSNNDCNPTDHSFTFHVTGR